MGGPHFSRSERGYAMAALLVAMSVMAIVLGTAMPVYQTVARREREAELIFRGEQYARAIGLYQRKYANALNWYYLGKKADMDEQLFKKELK